MKTAGRLSSDLADRIRRVAEVRTDEPVVISLYVNLDPTDFGRQAARDAQIESLIDRARSDDAFGTLSHDAKAILDRDLERVRTWAKESMDPSGVRGVALFCSTEADLFESFRLSAPVGPDITVGTTANLEPLIAALPGDAWCVFLVNRKTDRIMRGSRERLIETTSTSEEVHGQHDQGGWSQARYQRSVEKDVKDHVQHACDRLFTAFQHTPFDHLIIGCPDELRPELESKLHAYLRERLVQFVDAEVEHEGAEDVLERVRPEIEQYERRAETELLDRLSERLGRGERAVSGLAAVSDALDQQRVEVLLVAANAREAVMPDLIQRCILQAAVVRYVRYHEPERALGGPVAALLRF
ncbi:MAG TPA: Vms1/Ankzf1 family peptidyl-tRNA hydrolase [Actinomycetota bacterium]|jgi:peptide chain release factor subunit 1|nr:Vms1/Ankzf1 family peptidyl-tRNA hydrolase [Actinomycetota bacterium]